MYTLTKKDIKAINKAALNLGVDAERLTALIVALELPKDEIADIETAYSDNEFSCDGGINGFISEAISADGRGHFMSSYDGNEIESGDYFIYRTN